MIKLIAKVGFVCLLTSGIDSYISSRIKTDSSQKLEWEELDQPSNSCRMYRTPVMEGKNVVGYVVIMMTSGGDSSSMIFVSGPWSNYPIQPKRIVK